MSRKTLGLALLVVAVTACGQRPTHAPLVEPVETTAAQAPTAPPPVAVLASWDARRAEAWARGDPRLLGTLYTAGSSAGRRDQAMLHAWAARGLAVRGLHTQLLAVHEVTHTRSTWTLEVTDRLVGGVAVGRGIRRPLPRDGATTRTVRLRLVRGEWLVEGVTPQAD